MQTCQKIYCKAPLITNKKHELFYGMKMSARGDIRRKPNVISWCMSLVNLKRYGMDAAAVVQEWNEQAAHTDKLIGFKATAVRQVMSSMPENVLGLVCDAISKCDWEKVPWTEDGLANKKAYPGHNFRYAKSLGYSEHTHVTNESMWLHFSMASDENQKRHPAARRKQLKREFEEQAELAALAESIRKAAVFKLGLADSDIKHDFIDVLAVNGEPQLLLEVQSIQMEKPQEFSPERISVIKALALKKKVTTTSPAAKLQTKGVEESEFDCLISNIRADVAAMVAHAQKNTTYERTAYYADLTWRTRRQEEAKGAIEAIIAASAKMVAFTDQSKASKDPLISSL